VQHRRQLSAYGGLANAHHADQHDRPVDPAGDPRQIGTVERGGVLVHCRAAYSCATAQRKRRAVPRDDARQAAAGEVA
jgi:hypothetical protein